MLPVYGFSLTIFRSLANTSRREVLLIFLRSPITTWPVGLYMNGEIAQVQPGVLDLKSSILRSCNTCSAPRRKRCHGHRHYTCPMFHDVSLNELLPLHSLETIFITTFKTMLQIRIQTNTNLQQSSWILPVTDCSNLLVFCHCNHRVLQSLILVSSSLPFVWAEVLQGLDC
jgi:hypothetical protein